MLYLFFDSETTNLPNFKAKHSDPTQPHLVQLAACLTEADGTVIRSFSEIVSPKGWYLEMPPESFKSHGITYERAMADGIPLGRAVNKFNKMAREADVAVAFNIQFDIKIMQIAWCRANLWPQKDPFQIKECAMQLAKPLVRAAATEAMIAAGMGKRIKQPSLAEAYQFFFGKGFDNAHDAGADTLACKEVYFAAKRMLAEQAVYQGGQSDTGE